jgi:hypothetical protein
MVDTLLLRPLPVRHAERLVRLIEVHPTGFVIWDLLYALYEQLATKSSSLSEVVCQGELDVAFEEGTSSERIRINAVSGNFFSALGIAAHLGRVLTSSDDNAPVLSYDFWQRRFAGSPSILGRSIRLNGRAMTVVGVLPKGPHYGDEPEIRISIAAGRWFAQEDRGAYFQIFGMRELLLMTCGNVACLLLARSAARSREMGIRLALGASRWRLALTAWRRGRRHRRARLDARHRLRGGARGIGLYGALDFAVEAGRREVGVRVALGASPLRVVRLLARETLLLVAAGGLAGVAFYTLSAHGIRQVLYDVAPSGPMALGSALLFVAVVDWLAIVFPVWRAVRIDPALALREE